MLLAPDEVRALVRTLDDLDRKVLGGLTALMIAEPGKVRDQEWFAECFVQVAVVAHGFDPEESQATTEDVELVERYARARMPAVGRVAFALFVRTAEDLSSRGTAFTFEDARALVSDYLGG